MLAHYYIYMQPRDEIIPIHETHTKVRCLHSNGGFPVTTNLKTRVYSHAHINLNINVRYNGKMFVMLTILV